MLAAVESGKAVYCEKPLTWSVWEALQLAAEAEKKRVAVEKAEVEAAKARIDAEVPREMRPAAEWRKFQATWHEKRAALEKESDAASAERLEAVVAEGALLGRGLHRA